MQERVGTHHTTTPLQTTVVTITTTTITITIATSYLLHMLGRVAKNKSRHLPSWSWSNVLSLPGRERMEERGREQNLSLRSVSLLSLAGAPLRVQDNELSTPKRQYVPLIKTGQHSTNEKWRQGFISTLTTYAGNGTAVSLPPPSRLLSIIQPKKTM